MLEKTAIELNEKSPMLPTWLSPIQARIITVGEAHEEFAEEIYQKINASNIRVDIDDRDESVGKKIRNASKEWIPYIFVIGDKEVESGLLSVRSRKNGDLGTKSLEEFSAMLLDEIATKAK